MSLATPESVQRLQAALHAKAKGEPRYRFYMLYDKVYRRDVLAHAYECCRANRGAAGADGRTFEDIEAYGVERWLGELTEAGQPCLPGDGCPRQAAAASVVGRQAQGAWSGHANVAGPASARHAGPGVPGPPDGRLPVGESVKPSPRAGCGKTARPVR